MLTAGGRGRIAVLVLPTAIVLLSGPAAGQRPADSFAHPAPAVWSAATHAPLQPSTPMYYRPVVEGGKVFPLARSNFLSLIEIHHNWHALRLRYIDGRWQPVGVHEGIDISAERGGPILSMTSGAVENVGWTFYSGTRVGVRGTDGRYYFYAHLSWVAPGIVPGVRVQAGQLLGHVGNTGYGPPEHHDEFPPHLHFGIEVGATWVNPHPLLVSLYEATVASNERTQSALDDLAATGTLVRWQEAAGRAYTDFGG